MSENEARVREAAAEIFNPDGVEIWMYARNELLDGDTPMYLIEEGETNRVLGLIQALAEGVIF